MNEYFLFLSQAKEILIANGYAKDNCEFPSSTERMRELSVSCDKDLQYEIYLKKDPSSTKSIENKVLFDYKNPTNKPSNIIGTQIESFANSIPALQR